MRNLSVSILIPCYNAETWIGEAIESALSQTHPATEVVVYDDGSTDGSLDVIRRYDDRVRWGTGPNRGGGPARNWLLAHAQHDWIQYLDADDVLNADKVAGQVEALTSGAVPEDVDVLYGPVTFQQHDADSVHRHLEPVQYPNDPWASLVTWDLPQTGSPLWRKSALEAVGGWKSDQPVCQEHELYLRLLKAGCRFAYHPTNGAVYRLWSQDTVCRSDIARTYRHRLAITRNAEVFLQNEGQMTPARRRALDRAYLSCSRIIWTFDRPWARAVIRHMEDHRTLPFSFPDTAAPGIYRFLYNVIGFEGAERVASWKRTLTSLGNIP